VKRRANTHTAKAQGSSPPVPWRWRSRGARIRGLQRTRPFLRGHLDRGTPGSLLMAFPGTGNKGVPSTDAPAGPCRNKSLSKRPGAPSASEAAGRRQSCTAAVAHPGVRERRLPLSVKAWSLRELVEKSGSCSASRGLRPATPGSVCPRGQAGGDGLGGRATPSHGGRPGNGKRSRQCRRASPGCCSAWPRFYRWRRR
jgi:hypothetical protein